MRHILVHDYFRVDHEIVWGVVEKELAGLKAKLYVIAEELKRQDLDVPQKRD